MHHGGQLLKYSHSLEIIMQEIFLKGTMQEIFNHKNLSTTNNVGMQSTILNNAFPKEHNH